MSELRDCEGSSSTFLTKEEFARFKNGDRRIFKKIFERYFGLIHYVVRRCGIDNENGHDIVQDAFLKLYTNAREIRSEQSIKSWLVTTARNLSLDVLRKRKTEHKHAEQVQAQNTQDFQQNFGPNPTSSNFNMVSEQEVHELELLLLGGLIQKFESQLKDNTFSCFYCKGMSAKEIAERNNEPISTITNRLSRYRKQFRQLFKEHINSLRDSAY